MPEPKEPMNHASTSQPTVRRPLLLVAGLALAAAALTSWLSLRRYAAYNSGMLDLGNMAQAIASVTRGQPLVFTYVDGATSRLAFHVELAYVLFAPFYAIWPDPRLLLIGQAVLYASGALPAYFLAARRLEHAPSAALLATAYLAYPVALTAVLFDFHGDTLAMPILLWAIDALDRRAWRSYALWLALALSCKFYVAAPVALMGLVIWRWGPPDQRRAGLITAAVACAYGAAAFFVIRPLFTTAETSSAHRGLSYLSFYFGRLQELALSTLPRLLSAAVVFGPALLLALPGWRWLLPALPLTLAALLSTGPGGAYDYRYHHYAVAVPFIIAAMIDGAARRRQAALAPTSRPPRRNWGTDVAFSALTIALISALVVDQPLNPLFWLRLPGQGLDHAAYGLHPRDALKDRFLAEHVPPTAPIAASMFLASHLVNRETLYVTRYPDDPGGERLPSLLPRVDYVLADALFDWRVINDGTVAGGAAYEQHEIAVLLRDPSFGLVKANDGLLLFARDPGPAALAQSISTVPTPTAPTLAEIGPARLLHASVEPIGGRRFRASFTWSLSGAPTAGRTLAAVSRLEGVTGARIVHLPSYTLEPIGGWQPGQAFEERFEIELPASIAPGNYTWLVGWYDLDHSEAFDTDARSRLGAEYSVTTINLQ